jgi:hypothetical protein
MDTKAGVWRFKKEQNIAKYKGHFPELGRGVLLAFLLRALHLLGKHSTN